MLFYDCVILGSFKILRFEVVMGALYLRKRFLKVFLLLESFRILRFEVVMGFSIVNTKEIQIRRAKRAGGTFWGVLRAGGIFWGDFIGNTKEIQRKYKRKYKVGDVGHFEHLWDCWILCFRGIPCPFVPFCVVVGSFPQPPIASEKVPARSVQKRHFRGVGQFGKCVSGRKIQP